MTMHSPWPHVVLREGVAFVEKTQVRVLTLWGWWMGGKGLLAVDTIQRRYPQIKPAALLSALAYAAENREAFDEAWQRQQDLNRKGIER